MSHRYFLKLIAMLLIAWPATAELPSPESYLMKEAEELKLAASAAPAAISADATYYVLKREGFAEARKGTNKRCKLCFLLIRKAAAGKKATA